MKNVLTVFAVVAFVGMLMLCVTITRSDKTRLSETRTAPPIKTFSIDVTEGFRYRDFQHFGVDLLAFNACRIEKLRRGAVSFGAFNVLVLDDVIINLPKKMSGTGDVATSEAKEQWGLDKMNTDGFVTLFKSVQGLVGKKFSGVHVNELVVNRLVDGKTERLFFVKMAEGGIGKGEHIQLEGCVVYSSDGTGQNVGSARIELQPAPVLVYRKSGIEQRLAL